MGKPQDSGFHDKIGIASDKRLRQGCNYGMPRHVQARK